MLCPTAVPIEQFIAGYRDGLTRSERAATGNRRYGVILKFISDFELVFCFMPTIREIMALYPTLSTSSTLFALRRLASADYIDLWSGVARGMALTSKGRECIESGAVPCTSGRVMADAEHRAGLRLTTVPADYAAA